MEKEFKFNYSKHLNNKYVELISYILCVKFILNRYKKLCPKVCPEYWKKLNTGKKINAGCCVKCVENKGYHYKEDLDKIKRFIKFDKDYGFFDTDKKCCKLPVHLRSVKCLRYHCNPLIETLLFNVCENMDKLRNDIIFDIKCWDKPKNAMRLFNNRYTQQFKLYNKKVKELGINLKK